MAKYHIKKDGTPGLCRAKKGKCPLGGSESHYSNLEEAEVAAQSQLEAKFGVLAAESTPRANVNPGKMLSDSILKMNNSLVDDLAKTTVSIKKEVAAIQEEEKAVAKKYNWDYSGSGSDSPEAKAAMSAVYKKYRMVDLARSKAVSEFADHFSDFAEPFEIEDIIASNGGRDWTLDHMERKLSEIKSNNYTVNLDEYGYY